MRSAWSFVLAGALTIGLLLLGLRGAEEAPDLQNPALDPSRLDAALEELNPENLAHPIGTAHNRLIRTRIESKLREYGYTPEIQTDLICTSFGSGCSAVENIIAIKDGASDDAILVTAHYDSAPIAPGAGDDLAGIAVMLEAARQMANQTTRNDIVFLFADGEEAGLRGAMAFAQHHPLMKRIDLVLNMEARGVAGPSAMFETSPGNSALVSLFAGSVSRPTASSLLYEVYRRMPNNTDVTVYKNAGAMAMNFAFSRGVALYHSARDTSDNLSRASLAHHGDNVFTVLKNAADTPMESLRAEGDESYIDLFGMMLLHWPAAFNLPAAIAALLVIAGAGVFQRAFGLKRSAWALGAALLVIVLHLVFGWLLSFPLGIWPGIHPLDHPYPWPGRIALLGSSLLASLLVGAWIGRRAGWQGLLWVSWALLGVLGIALAVLIPGGTYLTLLPCAVFAICAGVETALRREPVIAAHLGGAVAAYVALYHFLSFDTVFNFQVSYLKTPILVLMALPASALAAWHATNLKSARGPLAAVAAVTVLATITGAVVPAYTESRPRSVNADYLQVENIDGTRETHWRLDALGPPDADYALRAGFPAERASFLRYGLDKSQAHLRPAPDLRIAGPQLRIVSDTRDEAGLRTIEGELTSGRGGFLYGLAFPSGSPVEELSVEGEVVAGPDAFSRPRGASAGFSGLGDRTLKVRIKTKATKPVEAILFELSAPPAHADLATIAAQRPANATPMHFGDHAETQRRLTF